MRSIFSCPFPSFALPTRFLLLGSLKVDQLESSNGPSGRRKEHRRADPNKGGKKPEDKVVKEEEGTRSKGKNDRRRGGGADADG